MICNRNPMLIAAIPTIKQSAILLSRELCHKQSISWSQMLRLIESCSKFAKRRITKLQQLAQVNHVSKKKSCCSPGYSCDIDIQLFWYQFSSLIRLLFCYVLLHSLYCSTESTPLPRPKGGSFCRGILVGKKHDGITNHKFKSWRLCVARCFIYLTIFCINILFFNTHSL